MIDALRSYFQLASGLAEMTASKAKETAATLIASGADLADGPQTVGDQMQGITDDLLEQAKTNREIIVGLVKTEVDRTVARMGFVREEELAAVRRHVQRLESQLRPDQALSVATTTAKTAASTAKTAASTAKTAASAAAGTARTAGRTAASAAKSAPGLTGRPGGTSTSSVTPGVKTTASDAAPERGADTATPAPGKKAAVKKAPVKKAAVRKAPAKETPAKKAAVKQPAPKRAAAKATTAKG